MQNAYTTDVTVVITLQNVTSIRKRAKVYSRYIVHRFKFRPKAFLRVLVLVIMIITLTVHVIKLKPCKSKTNLVYLKMFKSASQTLSAMFHRFGYIHKLTFVLPLEDCLSFGWPHSVTTDYIRPSKTGQFNIVCDHMVFNETTLAGIMPKDTVYITSLREPFSQFVSSFHYYHIAEMTGIPKTISDPVSEYLNNAEKYETIFQDPQTKIRFQQSCIPPYLSMTKNVMAFTLGIPLGYPLGTPDISNDWVAIKEHIEHLGRIFDVVIIVEYFAESLVLLKRFMCWNNFKDILYKSRNFGEYTNIKYTDDTIEVYKNRSPIDFYLYEYFKNRLMEQISEQDKTFNDEVRDYKLFLRDFGQFCNSVASGVIKGNAHALVYPSSRWSGEFTVVATDCELVNMDLEWLELLKANYDRVPVKVSMPEIKWHYC